MKILQGAIKFQSFTEVKKLAREINGQYWRFQAIKWKVFMALTAITFKETNMQKQKKNPCIK